MPDEFPCDVFLSHSAKDKAVAFRFQIGILKHRQHLPHPPCLGFDLPNWMIKAPSRAAAVQTDPH
ncbi:MAG: hypothetical protein ABIP85_20845 [Chthoniobacteraceae bacterium]